MLQNLTIFLPLGLNFNFFMTLFHWIIVLTLSLCLSCKNNPSNTLEPTPPVPIENKDNSEIDINGLENRHLWQKPQIVIEKMGDISDKVVADLGAGLGYFAFRLTPLAKKVIAIEVDTQMINFIEANKSKYLGKDFDKLECRLAQPNNPNIRDDEIDVLLIINTIAYLPELKSYLKLVQKALKPEGLLMIVDYKMKKIPITAPPREERLYLDQLEILLESTGFTIVESDDTSLEYQYIIQAKNNK